jgi:hypothetical protein
LNIEDILPEDEWIVQDNHQEDDNILRNDRSRFNSGDSRRQITAYFDRMGYYRPNHARVNSRAT